MCISFLCFKNSPHSIWHILKALSGHSLQWQTKRCLTWAVWTVRLALGVLACSKQITMWHQRVWCSSLSAPDQLRYRNPGSIGHHFGHIEKSFCIPISSLSLLFWWPPSGLFPHILVAGRREGINMKGKGKYLDLVPSWSSTQCDFRISDLQEEHLGTLEGTVVGCVGLLCAVQGV